MVKNMKNRLYTAICIVMLIALLSVAFFGKIRSDKEIRNKNNLQQELLAGIDITLGNYDFIEGIHVSNDEEKIYIFVREYESESFSENNEEEYVFNEEEYAFKNADTTIVKDRGIAVYEISKNRTNNASKNNENNAGNNVDTYSAPMKLENIKYNIQSVFFDDENMYFIGGKNNLSESKEENLLEDEENMFEVSDLYSARIADGKITDVIELQIDGNKEIDIHYADINAGKLFFYGHDRDNNDEEGKYYIADINVSNHKIQNINEIKGYAPYENMSKMSFVDNGEKMLTEVVYLSDDYMFAEFGYELVGLLETDADSQSKIVSRNKIDFKETLFDALKSNADGSSNYRINYFEVNTKTNTLYYIPYEIKEDSEIITENADSENADTAVNTATEEEVSKEKTKQNMQGTTMNEHQNDKTVSLNICKAIYNASIQELLEFPEGDTDYAYIEDASQSSEEYHKGDYSYDEFDTGNFDLQLRNKSGMAEKSGVWYEIFVRAFADSDGDGIGDFNGITQKLDYLKELGIDGIWLMPINESPSYHGYDVTDYMSLNSDYGTEEDFKNLLDAAHEKGIKVIMDFVINHTSSEHVWFKLAASDVNSEERNYYRWVYKNDSVDYSKSDRSNWGSSVWKRVGDSYYYALFGADMPDLNYNNPKVREEIKRAAGKWLEMGVDGFRLDAAMHIYGNNEFKQQDNPTESTIQWWNEFAIYCEEINPDVYLVGEAWNDGEVLEEYVQPFDTKFNFAFEQLMLEAVKEGTATVESDGQKNLSYFLQEILEKYSSIDTNYLDGIFGTNHDQNRIMSQVNDEAKARLVANIYMTLQGNPFIYYGEELGLFGQKPDEMIRTPFKWSNSSHEHEYSFNTTWIADPQNVDTPSLEEQMKKENAMVHFYKKLISVRKENPALIKGNYTATDVNNEFVMAYKRECDEQKVFVIHNLSENKQMIDVSEFDNFNVIYCSGAENDIQTSESMNITKNIEDRIKTCTESGKLELYGMESVVLEFEHS